MVQSKIEKIASIKEEIKQLKERQRLLQQPHNAQERKDRTKRLCRRMGLFESLLPDTIPLTDEQLKTFLEKTVTTEQSRRILDGLTAHNTPTAATQGANPVPTAKTAHTAQENGTGEGEDRATKGKGLTPFPVLRARERHTYRAGNLNREIEVTNQKLRELKARISKLQNWLKEEQASTAPTTPADYIQDILKRKAQAGKSDISQSLYNLKDAANMLNFLTANHIIDMAGLDKHFSSMLDKQIDIRDKLNPLSGVWLLWKSISNKQTFT